MINLKKGINLSKKALAPKVEISSKMQEYLAKK